MTTANTELVKHDTQELVRREEERLEEERRFLPVMTLTTAHQRRDAIEAVKRQMKVDVDYGIIPGTQNPTLLQPGAEKLNSMFGLVPTFEVTASETDWTGERHSGEPFFHYEVKCKLFRGQWLMGEGDGSCNSWESRYRWRTIDRECPECQQPAIRRSTKEPGWYCWAKIGGCGRQYKDGTTRAAGIAALPTGRKPNPDIADQVNTIRKMANKRAKIAATLNALSAHEFFTQDVEDNAPAESTATAYDDAKRKLEAALDEAEAIYSKPEKTPPPKAPVTDVHSAGEIRWRTHLWPRLQDPKKPENMSASRVKIVFDELRAGLNAIEGDDHEYMKILEAHGMSSAAESLKVGAAGIKACLLELHSTLERWLSKNTPPPAEASAEEDPDWKALGESK